VSKLQDYKCKACGEQWTSEWVDSDDPIFRLIPCPFCYEMGIKKSYSISVKASMPEHFNMATGKVESSERSIREEFKRKSAEATERTGIEHNFQPVDLRDKEALGVTDDGLDATYRRLRDEGKTESKTYVQMEVPKVDVHKHG
jgi:hypothetical protein